MFSSRSIIFLEHSKNLVVKPECVIQALDPSIFSCQWIFKYVVNKFRDYSWKPEVDTH